MTGGQESNVSPEEMLARFILQRNRLRPDLTIKPDAFIPPSNLELSVTRHLDLNEEGLWKIGRSVAQQMGKNLHARADVQAAVVEGQQLRVVPAPIPENPNHANITGWPSEKHLQKNIAQEIAASAGNAIEVPPGL